MGSHFSSIGFPIRSYEEFEDLLEHVVGHGERIAVEGGAYVRWSPGAGVELWAQVYDDGGFGMVPHFSGESVMSVGLTKRIRDPDASELDGAFYAWADPADKETPESGAFPFIFEAPDYVMHRELALPVVVEASISAFAHHLTAYPDEEAYYASGTGFAAEFFIPSGTFRPGGEAVDPPEATALFAGRVLDCSLLTNPSTGSRFWWAKVRHFGGEMDVVADSEDIAGEIVPDGTIDGGFWLSGQISSLL